MFHKSRNKETLQQTKYQSRAQYAIACPRSNGQVERFNSTILNAMMTAIGEDYEAWELKIPEVQCGINGTISATTGYAPAELLFRFRPRLKYDIDINSEEQINRQLQLKTMRDRTLKNINKNAEGLKTRYNKNRISAKTYNIGDMVMFEKAPTVKGFSSGKLVQWYIGPFRVVKVLPNDRYVVKSLSKNQRRFHGVVTSDKLKLFKTQSVD